MSVLDLATKVGCTVGFLHRLEDGEAVAGQERWLRKALAALDDGALWDRFEAAAAMDLQLAEAG